MTLSSLMWIRQIYSLFPVNNCKLLYSSEESAHSSVSAERRPKNFGRCCTAARWLSPARPVTLMSRPTMSGGNGARSNGLLAAPFTTTPNSIPSSPCRTTPTSSTSTASTFGYGLFEKYGRIVGERDCSTIAPLDEREADDREALIDLYQRADPEPSAMNPPGWKLKRRGRARFWWRN
jgi:hypothetical protein